MEKKVYQKISSYTKKVILSKIGEDWRRKEDSMKNTKNWPLVPSRHPGGAGEKYTKKKIHMPRGSFCPNLVKIR